MQIKHSGAKDIFSILMFLVVVVVGALLINTFVFRSFSVTGPSMESTLYTNDRLIVNRLPATWAWITSSQWLPDRGEIIVFENPRYHTGEQDRYLVKRVIGLPGERVEVAEGRITVYNSEFPNGFNPDLELEGPSGVSSGEISTTIPEDHIFVSGDHRNGNFSFDSRNGLGTVPLDNVQGPVKLRIFPFNKIRLF